MTPGATPDATPEGAPEESPDDLVELEAAPGLAEGVVSAEGVLTVVVPALLDGVRVDRAVALLTGSSRGAVSELVAQGRVSVDGVAVRTRSAPLVAGGLLEVELPPVGEGGLEPEEGVEFAVRYEDAQVVVVDKPAGLVVHPGAGHARGTLAAGLLARYPDLADLVAAGVCDPLRPGIVHRLDRGTSGLLAVARTEAAYGSLVAQLAARQVERRYLGLVEGRVEDERGLVEAPIGRSARTPTRMAISAQGREARTGYTVLRRYDHPRPTTLVELSLQTGRTHQIRVHLAAIGHPVVGDDRYSAPGVRLARPQPGAGGVELAPGRLFLHAFRLGFEHPGSGQRVVVGSPLPADLEAYLGESPLR